jgi:nitrite reductase/ring-hydroxylating ferredoxin subunit
MSESPVETMHRLAATTRAGYSFDQEYYVSDAVFQADMEQVIGRKWILAGHASQVPNKGDYFLFRIGVEQIIVIRENATSVRAFFNVCRHRGSTLCSANSGNAPRLVCPYHAWTYGLDGKLIAARLMPDDFDKADNGLFACHIRVFHGLIFINMSESEPDDFDATFGDMGPILDYHGIAAAIRPPPTGSWSSRISSNAIIAFPRTPNSVRCTRPNRSSPWAPDQARVPPMRWPASCPSSMRGRQAPPRSGDRSAPSTRAPPAAICAC